MGQEIFEESSVTVSTEVARDTEQKIVVKRQTFLSMYKDFRKSGLSKLDSAFNALYISQTNRLCSRTVSVNDVGDGFFKHPAGWFKEKEERVRRATHTRSLRFLNFTARFLSHFSSSVEPIRVRSGFFFDNSVVTLKNVRRVFKKALPSLLAIACSAVLITAVYINTEKDTVIEFSVNGTPIGEVASAKTVETALNRVNSEISLITGETFSFPFEISYSLKNTDKARCLDINEVYDRLSEYTEEYTEEGYGLYIDSRLIAVLDSRDDIMSVLDKVKGEHMKLTGENEDIANKIDIKYQEYSPSDFTTPEALMSMFSVEQSQEEEPTITKALLAVPTSPSTLSLEAATPEFREKMEMALEENNGNAIVLDFEVFYEETVRESVPYETEYREDSTLFEGQEVVIVSGKTGTADNTYKVKYINGEETGRELIEQSIIREPRTSVVKVGTRVIPEKMDEDERGSKYMINPVPAALVTSHFGWRVLRGRSDHHDGLDLAAPKGTPIYAAASGEVIYAGYNGSYGNYIKIRHPDGLVTLYAHCSELFVKTGDTVSQADEIALVGSTGNSTGYHCHLEVYDDGVRVDPEKFIYSMD